MKIQFDSSQQYQLDATAAVVDLFEGQPLAQGRFEVSLDAARGEMFSESGRGNALSITEETLLSNLHTVQARNGIPPSPSLEGRHFSIEMETGTGKTYVYLRTIYELHARYGFTKFIIVVPNVAIREGVLSSIRLTQDHFGALYDNTPCDARVYDSKRVSMVREFAAANTLQVLVMNIDAFNKSSTIMRKESDKMSGRRPLEFLEQVRPVVILDEPQNMESEIARAAIASLNPLCTLRYSATHRNRYNLLYRLGPVQAYDLDLVKKIGVTSVLDGADFNKPFVCVESISATKTKVTAKLTLDVKMASEIKRKTISIPGPGADLEILAGRRELYRGYIVEEINYESRYITFSNGITLGEGDIQGTDRDALMRVQVYETVKAHLEKEIQIQRQLPEGRRVKVLSLFFIDRVAHYFAAEGKIRKWFQEVYEELSKKPRYLPLAPPPVEKVHNGYFAQSRGVAKDTNGETAADDEAYELIMRDKQRLMDPAEPLRFIFSHSALREGWDNPNVFQICTLNESKSEMRKRQEIGRGLRLAVDETGARVHDSSINRLVVVANESYIEFASKLQTEIEKESGDHFTGRIVNTKDDRKVNLIPGWQAHPDFLALWHLIRQKTRYSVEYSAADLTKKAAEYLRKGPEIVEPAIKVQSRQIQITQQGVTARLTSAREDRGFYRTDRLPDLLGYLQRETRLTRKTLAEILVASGRLEEVWKNPQQFLDMAARGIKVAKQEMMINGIKYEPVPGPDNLWDMMRFDDKELKGGASRMVEVCKSLYDVVECDSDTERKFAEGLDGRGEIRFFLKLPRWFEIDTPLGKYRPDWAIVKEDEPEGKRLFLVRETKSTLDQFAIRPTEQAKITCGKAHFEALPPVLFAKATSPEEV